jgi:hypothetical protein
MSQRTDAVVVSTIGIDTGKNALHLVGLDDQGAGPKFVVRTETATARYSPFTTSRPSPRQYRAALGLNIHPGLLHVP